MSSTRATHPRGGGIRHNLPDGLSRVREYVAGDWLFGAVFIKGSECRVE
ncbi:MAG: hypothetical protein GX256_02415 [Fretibacterium sp.]|nr:hypothetical protein [Fretibacterium sp.]